jgi:DNA primase
LADVKQIKEANDIVDVVGGYVSLRPAGATFKGLCPFHDDHRPSFDVDPRRQRFRCWSCDKYGDVISFVQEYERVSFVEALELLAKRAGITLEKRSSDAQNVRRALMLDVVRWAAKQYHECLLDSPLAEEARRYLGERALKGETVRKYELGYAPANGVWLVQRAEAAGIDKDVLEKVGLIAARTEGPGHYDRFRDRVQFPIRDVRGRVVGFGGRILPSNPLADRVAKYYNSSDSPLFSKSELLYGLDQARLAGAKAGYLAVVEGYTDVLMAHQAGIMHVVATMGTALNARHVQNLRRFAGRVVLVFDADAGGDTGVDRALELFASQDVDLAIATLPAGQDPCDLLVEQGPDAFREVLDSAADALEFKLNRVLAGRNGREEGMGVEGQRRAVDAVLGIIALAPPLKGQAGAVRTQLMVNRIARRLGLKEETVWARLEELAAHKRNGVGQGSETRNQRGARPSDGEAPARSAPAAPEERQLLEVLLADEALVAEAAASIPADEVQHPGLRRLLTGLYELLAEGAPATLDQLRVRLEDGPLARYAMDMQDVGLQNPNRAEWFRMVLNCFQDRRARSAKQKLQTQLQSVNDHQAALELLRRLQLENRSAEPGLDPSSAPGGPSGDPEPRRV